MLNKPSYKQLLDNFQAIKNIKLAELFNTDSLRAKKFSLELNGIFFDYSKNNITDEILSNLIKLANESALYENIHAMFAGKKINNTEDRAVLHTLLRNSQNTSVILEGENVSPAINHVLQRMLDFANKLHNNQHVGYTGKPITDIVNIGIGGSDLGPNLVCEALKPYRKNKLNIHFISSVDGYALTDVLENLNPETTIFIIASKTFTTQETMTNAQSARKWFLRDTNDNINAISKHFVACSTNCNAVLEFGISADNMFEFWDFVGGRYSLWSAIGLPILLYIGTENFLALLNGAAMADEHFLTAPFAQNIPVLMGLIGVWYVNFYNYPTQVILPYNTRLNKLADYLQQQQMESNGKNVNKNGETILYQTCPVIWGGSGINGQHAYFQLLHQGTQIHPMDLIVTISAEYSDPHHQDILMSNIIAQSEAFMRGKATEIVEKELLDKAVAPSIAKFLAKHKTFEGNRPTNTFLLQELSPYYLGALIALYEHKTFVQGVIWEINSFDQWGVELGKELAKTILHNIESGLISPHDASTTQLIQHYVKTR